MHDKQLDLFAGSGPDAMLAAPPPIMVQPAAPAELDDAALLAAIQTAGLIQGTALAAEIGRRHLHAAIPVLEAYCRRFAGFGTVHALPEQIAALDALIAIGSADAANAVARIITNGWIQGPTLINAAAAAAQLRARLPGTIVLTLLRHADPATRANACRLARLEPDIITTLIDLLGDLHRTVSLAAACALGRMARPEARPTLKRALCDAPSEQIIEAVLPIADDECIVLLGRIARSPSDLAAIARDALTSIEHPLAERLSQRLSQRLSDA